MNDRLREFGEVPGYEFDMPRGSSRARPGHARPGHARPGDSVGELRRQASRQAAAEPAPAARLTRDILAVMRARNWVTGLAIPILAAIACGIAAVVVVGGNGGGTAPSVLSAGFAPARPAAADFTGGTAGSPAEVPAIASAHATEVAAGSADRMPALWVSADGGGNWHRAVAAVPGLTRAGGGQFVGVAHGASGWLAVGTAMAAAATPVVIGSPDGQQWQAVRTAGVFTGHGPVAATAVAAGRAGYVIVGHASAGPHMVAAAWHAPALTGWQRATDARPGALDGTGNRAMYSVTATSRGFAAVGTVGTRPAAWISAAGRAWTLVPLPLPDGAASAALDYVAANGSVVAAAGTEVSAAGKHLPFAAVSADAGATWTFARLPVPAAGVTGAANTAAAPVTVTALTAAGGGFTATGSYGMPSATDVVVWTIPPGAAAGTPWTEATPQGTGLAGPGTQAITALTVTGATLTGVGFTATGKGQEPTIWQSPIRYLLRWALL